jgi:hypothetical protein
MGDEQMWFVPRKPNLGVHVTISVTSQRHHDARAIMLGGPIDPGPVTEKVGPLGFVWSWTVAPTAEAFHEWTFYADGLRSCITSGFNSYAPLGATSTPTPTSPPTNTAGPTSTSTPTLVPRPVLTSLEPTFGSCNTFVRARGSGFGTTAGTINFIGPSGQLRPAAISWSDAEVDFAVPSGVQFGTYNVLIAVSGAPASNPLTFLVSTSASPTNTPTALPTFTATPTPGTC